MLRGSQKHDVLMTSSTNFLMIFECFSYVINFGQVEFLNHHINSGVRVREFFVQASDRSDQRLHFIPHACSHVTLPSGRNRKSQENSYNSKTVIDNRMLPTMSVPLDICVFTTIIDDVMQCSSAPQRQVEKCPESALDRCQLESFSKSLQNWCGG